MTVRLQSKTTSAAIPPLVASCINGCATTFVLMVDVTLTDNHTFASLAFLH